MKYPLLLALVLSSTYFVQAQNIEFDLAAPQPDLIDVYGGSFASGDIDNDGDLDLLVSGLAPNRQTRLYTNNGSGEFTEVADTPFPNASETVSIFEDLDDDGDLDLFFSGAGSGVEGFVHIYLNDGTGNFILQPNNGLPLYRDSGAKLGDLDGDGDADLLICVKDLEGNFIADVHMNIGNGNFMASGNTDITPVQFGKIAFLDAENDGDLDVIITGEQEDETSLTALYLNDGDGSFTQDSNSSFVQMTAADVDAVDTDNDGDMDLLLSGSTDAFEVMTVLYINDGNGGFTALENTGIQNTFAGTNCTADLDNDGDQDLLIVGSQDGGLPNIFNIVYENMGNNEFMPVDTLGGEYIPACIIDDFNGDGLKDAIIQGFVDDTNVYWNETVTVSVNDVEQDQQVTIFPNPSAGTFNLKLGDFNACVDLKIYDGLGKVVYSESNFCDSSRRLSLNLPAGAYVLTLNSASTFISKELIIQR